VTGSALSSIAQQRMGERMTPEPNKLQEWLRKWPEATKPNLPIQKKRQKSLFHSIWEASEKTWSRPCGHQKESELGKALKWKLKKAKMKSKDELIKSYPNWRANVTKWEDNKAAAKESWRRPRSTDRGSGWVFRETEEVEELKISPCGNKNAPEYVLGAIFGFRVLPNEVKVLLTSTLEFFLTRKEWPSSFLWEAGSSPSRTHQLLLAASLSSDYCPYN